MRKEIKEKKKKLDKKYSDYLFEVLQYLQKQNLSKYAYYEARDMAIEEIYEGQVNEEDVQHIFHHGYETYFNKKMNRFPKKNIAEKIGSVCFIFFFLLSILALVVYLYRFTSNVETFRSKGIYLYVTPSNLATMCAYGFLGAILSLLIQKNDRKTKYISIIIASVLGITVVVTLFAIGANSIKIFKLNMILVLVLGIALSVGGFLTEDLISRRKCLSKSQVK